MASPLGTISTMSANSIIPDRRTAQKLGMPKNESDCSTPINSTTMVTELMMNKSATLPGGDARVAFGYI
jgi:hypothetical protein